MSNPPTEQLQALNAVADKTLRDLMHLLNHNSHLAVEIKQLAQSTDILKSFRLLAEAESETAEQVLRLALATTVNFNTLSETADQLAAAKK